MNASTAGGPFGNASNANDRSSRPIWLGEDHRGWDHVRVHRQLIVDPRTTADHIAVYCGLALHAELQTGDTRPAEKTLGGYVGSTEKHVREQLRQLEEWRYIEIVKRPGKASVYRLLPPPEVSTPRSVGPTLLSTPRSVGPDTSVLGTDEQEPRTRLVNNHLTTVTRARFGGSVDNGMTNAWLLQRDCLIREGRGCSACSALGVLEDHETNTAAPCPRCEGSGIAPAVPVQ